MKTQLKILLALFLLLYSYAVFSQQDTTKTVVHIVLFRFNDGTTQKQIDSLFAAVDNLKNTIPGIVEINHGRDFSNRAQGYTHGETIRFRNKTALKDFYTHPAHEQLIREHIKPLVAGILVMDWEESDR